MPLLAEFIDIVIRNLIQIAIWVVIINAVLSWLFAFGVLNRHNRVVDMIARFTQAVTEPLLAPLRRFVPLLGGVDVTPIILILLLSFADRALAQWAFSLRT